MKYSSWVIGPFLRPQLTSSDRRHFNYQLARLRVRSGHAIGVLKGRFASWRELRVRFSGPRDFDAATGWILSCCVLHIICVQMEDPPLGCADELGRDKAWVPPGVDTNAVRNGTMEKVCTFMRANGVYQCF